MESRLTYHFRDGSVDDDTAIFTQQGTLHLVRDHHVQRGPFFSKATDILVEGNGNVMITTTGRDGKKTLETNHIDLPPDISNGVTGTMLLNVSASTEPFRLGFVIPTGKGRIHPEMGGVAGLIAPMLGKQPKDVFVWVLEGDVPGLVSEIGPLEEGGPVVSVEPAGATIHPPLKSKNSRPQQTIELYRSVRSYEVASASASSNTTTLIESSIYSVCEVDVGKDSSGQRSNGICRQSLRINRNVSRSKESRRWAH